MGEINWIESVSKVREFDENLADELTGHFLQAGYALSGIIAKIIYKKENN